MAILLALCTCGSMTVSPAAAGASVAPASRDTATTPLQLRTRMSGWGAWVGGSLFASSLIAKTKDARFGLVALQFGHVLATEGTVAVRFSTDLFPAAVLVYPDLPPLDGVPPSQAVAPSTSPAYGIGAAPVGLQFIYRTHRPVQPFFGGSGGFMYFPEPVPDRRGRRLNYTFDVSAGVRWILNEHRVLTVGYRFHHLSNGFRGEINPGFDANIIFLGLSTM